jgi:hypothetical protein
MKKDLGHMKKIEGCLSLEPGKSVHIEFSCGFPTEKVNFISRAFREKGFEFRRFDNNELKDTFVMFRHGLGFDTKFDFF